MKNTNFNKQHKKFLTRDPSPFTLHRKGQSTIEFTFAMVVCALLIYGLLQIFRWVGMDYAERAWTIANKALVDKSPNPTEQQLNKDVYRSKRLNAFTRNF